VVHPYPLNANLELHADRRTLALWLACCADKDVLFAMFHKPASPGMVVIEVDHDFDSFENLLGLHTWSEFLQRPTEEELEKASKVFYCTYNTGRKVEKNGWKRVNVEEHWFHGWSANNAVIRYPYPKTRHCEVPFEAQTGAPMCRPLPQRYFPVPPPAPAPPVGSPGWLAGRNVNPPASPVPSTTRRGQRAPPHLSPALTSQSQTFGRFDRSEDVENFERNNPSGSVRSPETQASEVGSALGVQFMPGGPGSSWGDPDEPW